MGGFVLLRRPWLLAVLVVLTSASCGRVGYDFAPPIEQVDVRALDGTRMLQGETLRIEVTISPPEAAIFGRTVTMSAQPGRLDGQHELAVGSADGGPVVIELSAGMAVRDGRMLLLDSDAPAMGGDLRYLVEAGPMVTIDVDGIDYEVADDLTVEAPLGPADPLVDRSATLLMTEADSGFGAGPLLVANDPYELFDGSSGALTAISTSGDVPPSGRIAQAQVVYDGSAYGEQIFACFAGATGGLYSILASGATSLVRPGGCNGVIAYGDYVYFHVTDEGLLKLLPDGSTEVMVPAAEAGLPNPPEGFFLGICPSYFLPAKLVLFSAGTDGVGTDGFTMAFEPWEEPVPWAQNLSEPVSATFDGDLPFGTVMLVALFGSGELIALRDDATQQLVVGGLSQPTSVTADGDGGIWIVDQGEGRILRLSRID
jgi:hypothetical protein